MPETAIRLAASRGLVEMTGTVLAEIVRLLVNEPDRVVVETRIESRTAVIAIRVSPGDLGTVIGKQGRTVRSLRVVLSSISGKTGLPFELEVREEG